MRILVTGATGNTGSPLVEALAKSGNQIVAITRDPSSSSSKHLSSLSPNVEVTTIDHAFDKQIDRVYSCFAVTPDLFVAETEFFRKCNENGVKYIVKLATTAPVMTPYSYSFYGRSHLAIEHFLELGSIPFTSLRPAVFYNYSGFSLDAKEKKEFKTVFHGDINVIDAKDTAKAAAALLLLDDPSPHYGKRYNLEGPETLNGDKMAEIASEFFGEKIVSKGEYSIEEQTKILSAAFPEDLARGIAMQIHKGDFKRENTKTSEELLKLCPPSITFRDYLSLAFLRTKPSRRRLLPPP